MLNTYAIETIMKTAYYEVIDKLGLTSEPELIISKEASNELATGYYNHTRNIVVVILSEDIEQMVESLCHECRHAWQYERYGKAYLSSVNSIDHDDYLDYYYNEYEVDAREYAEANYKDVYEYAYEANEYLLD